MSNWRLRVVIPTFYVSDDHSFNKFLNTPYCARMTGVDGDSTVAPSKEVLQDPAHEGWVIAHLVKDRQVQPISLIEKKHYRSDLRQCVANAITQLVWRDLDPPIGA